MWKTGMSRISYTAQVLKGWRTLLSAIKQLPCCIPKKSPCCMTGSCQCIMVWLFLKKKKNKKSLGAQDAIECFIVSFFLSRWYRIKATLSWIVRTTWITFIHRMMYTLATVHLFFLLLLSQWRNSMTIQYFLKNGQKYFHFHGRTVMIAFLYNNKILQREHGPSVKSCPPILG